MKDAFKRAMVHLWPNGIIDMGSREQLRDLVRVFSMGWLEAMMTTGQREAVESVVDEYNAMTRTNWFPDSSWDWTSLCDQSRN